MTERVVAQGGGRALRRVTVLLRIVLLPRRPFGPRSKKQNRTVVLALVDGHLEGGLAFGVLYRPYKKAKTACEAGGIERVSFHYDDSI